MVEHFGDEARYQRIINGKCLIQDRLTSVKTWSSLGRRET